MAESEAVTPPRLPASTKEHKRNSRFPFRRPVGERGSQQEVDLESGLVAAQGETIEPRGSPRLASSFAEDVDFMVVGRFSYLHTRVLVRRQDEIRRLKQRLGRLDRADALAGSEQRFGTPSERGENHARDWLLKTIDEKLSIYNTMVLRLQSQRQTTKPGVDQFRCIRQYLWHKSHDEMSYTEETDPQWVRYGNAVKEILEDPNTAPWLDGPLDPGWTTTYFPRKKKGQGTSLEELSSRILTTPRSLAQAVGILIWISHITAALGYVMMANTSGSNNYSTINSVLAYWYFTAVSIVVHELLSKGFVYARKVILGGILACGGGSYALFSIWNVAAASTLSAMPAFFTIVLLLIRII